LLTASISPDLFTAPPPGNAISIIKEGFRDKSKHLRESAPRGARTRARSCARFTAKNQRVMRRRAAPPPHGSPTDDHHADRLPMDGKRRVCKDFWP
jgi:hypothetical protein